MPVTFLNSCNIFLGVISRQVKDWYDLGSFYLNSILTIATYVQAKIDFL